MEDLEQYEQRQGESNPEPEGNVLSPVEGEGKSTEEGQTPLDEVLSEQEPDITKETAEEEPLPSRTVNKKGAIQIKVELLEGKDFNLEVDRKATSDMVINQAHKESQTLETDFFSIFFYDDHEREHKEQVHHLRQKIFLIPKKQLRAQFSSIEKETLTEPWEYHYGVKFYVPDPNNSKLLKDDHSRFLYCLQLCDDIRANRVHVDRETAIRLVALMLQGKLGDYEEETHQAGYYQQFPQFQLLPESRKPSNYEAQLIEVHKAKAGYTPAQADSEFLSIAKDLSRYGEHLFLAKTMREEQEECRMVTIGNGYRGISIYYEDKEDKERTHVPWKNIVKISYKRDKFRIIYHPSEDENTDEETNEKRPKISTKFYAGTRLQAKRIWKNAVEQHVFFHLDSTDTPNIVNSLFMRSSMRYSFKKTLPSKKKNPEPVDDKTDRSREVIPRDLPKDDGEEWVMLAYPPLYDPEASKQQEHQKVQVDFKATDNTPDAHRFIIRRERVGSYEVLDSLKTSQIEDKERSFSLSVLDESSKTSTVCVSLNVDPPSGVKVTSGDQEKKGVPIFDSDRMPVVNLGSASMVTTATVIEQDGRRLTTGEHSQKYPLEELGDMLRDLGGPALDGTEEAEQVKQFLDKEQKVFQRVGNALPPDVEITVT